MAENTNKLGDFTKSTLESVRSMLDANTVVGDPITTPQGVTIIPISKISVGYASGGLDYPHKTNESKPNTFGGGGGTGVSVIPVALLVIGSDGNVNVLNVNSSSTQTSTVDSVSQIVGLIERSPELIEKIKGTFKKEKAPDTKVDF